MKISGKNLKILEKIGQFRKKSERFGWFWKKTENFRKNQKISEKIGKFQKKSDIFVKKRTAGFLAQWECQYSFLIFFTNEKFVSYPWKFEYSFLKIPKNFSTVSLRPFLLAPDWVYLFNMYFHQKNLATIPRKRYILKA